MPEDKLDSRIKKTVKLVYDAMYKLLSFRRFNQLTVNELCETAQISRATFYVHFVDKYDLLKIWLKGIMTDAYNNSKNISVNNTEEYINAFINENKKIIENVFLEADSETIQILFEVLSSFTNINTRKDTKTDPEYIVLTNLYIGGMIRYLQWHAENKFPKDISVYNKYLSGIINKFIL